MRASTSAFRSFRIPTQSTLETIQGTVLSSSESKAQPSTKECASLRQSHIIAGFQRDLDNSGAVYVHLFAGSGVASCHSAGLVETMRLHPACIVCHKNLEHHRLIYALQLQEMINVTEL